MTTFVLMTLGRAAFVSVRRVRLALLLRAAAVANQHPDTSRHVSNIQCSSLLIFHCAKIKKGFARLPRVCIRPAFPPSRLVFRVAVRFRCKQTIVATNLEPKETQYVKYSSASTLQKSAE